MRIKSRKLLSANVSKWIINSRSSNLNDILSTSSHSTSMLDRECNHSNRFWSIRNARSWSYFPWKSVACLGGDWLSYEKWYRIFFRYWKDDDHVLSYIEVTNIEVFHDSHTIENQNTYVIRMNSIRIERRIDFRNVFSLWFWLFFGYVLYRSIIGLWSI